MQISRAELESLNSSDVLDLPCFKFSGNVFTNTGKRYTPEELKRALGLMALPVAKSILKIAWVYAQDKAVMELPGGNQVIIPETDFHCVPDPGAFTYIQGGEGEIQINLGLFLTFIQMPRTIRWLIDFTRHAGEIPIDAILTMDIPRQFIDEVKGVMQIWSGVARTGTVDVAAILSSLPDLDAYSVVVQQMLVFTAFHEFAHWFQTVYRPNEWAELTRKTNNYLTSWLSEDQFMSQESRQQISQLFSARPDIMTSWAEEVQADILAVQNCQWYFRDSDNDDRKARQQVYAAQAMLYSMLVQLSEVFYESVLKKHVGWQTHPPAYIRKNIFCYIGSRI